MDVLAFRCDIGRTVDFEIALIAGLLSIGAAYLLCYRIKDWNSAGGAAEKAGIISAEETVTGCEGTAESKVAHLLFCGCDALRRIQAKKAALRTRQTGTVIR